MTAGAIDRADGPRRILVTGGLGFIGFHLSRTLLATYPDCRLTIVDNLSSTRLDYRSLVDRADIRIEDLRDFAPSDAKFDDIYHLASPVGSLGILDRHGLVAGDILELAHAASALASRCGANLLYLSSSEVYGRDGQHDEASDLIVPDRRGTRMEYALGKLTAEHVLANLADVGTHRLRTVRPFNVVGPWQSASLGFVFPAFFDAALAGTELAVHGDGRQTRSFCHVDDLVAALIAVQKKGKAGALYNVGNPDNRVTILELARRIVRLCGSSSVIRLIDPRARYGKHYLEAYNKMPAIERVVRDTGWRPRRTLSLILSALHEFHSGVISRRTATACGTPEDGPVVCADRERA